MKIYKPNIIMDFDFIQPRQTPNFLFIKPLKLDQLYVNIPQLIMSYTKVSIKL